MPTAAREHTARGFNEFTKYYIRLINRLDSDLDSSYLRQSSRDCETCNRLANDATNDAAKGYRYQGGIMTMTYISPAHMTETGAETAFTIRQDPYAVLDPSGAAVPGLSGKEISGLSSGSAGKWEDDHWVLTELSFG